MFNLENRSCRNRKKNTLMARPAVNAIVLSTTIDKVVQ